MTTSENYSEIDLWRHASARDTEEVWTARNGVEWPLWHVVTTLYEDEEPVLAAGGPGWPMGEQDAEFLAKTMRAAATAMKEETDD